MKKNIKRSLLNQPGHKKPGLWRWISVGSMILLFVGVTIFFLTEQNILTRGPKKTSKKTGGQIVGGVVPHHDLIQSEIANFWVGMKKETSPQTIILIGPDHPNLGSTSVTLPQTNEPWGEKVVLDETILENLARQKTISRNDHPFYYEHSISLHVPYITSLFPEAKLVPVILRSDTTLSETLKLAEEL